MPFWKHCRFNLKIRMWSACYESLATPHCFSAESLTQFRLNHLSVLNWSSKADHGITWNVSKLCYLPFLAFGLALLWPFLRLIHSLSNMINGIFCIHKSLTSTELIQLNLKITPIHGLDALASSILWRNWLNTWIQRLVLVAKITEHNAATQCILGARHRQAMGQNKQDVKVLFL